MLILYQIDNSYGMNRAMIKATTRDWNHGFFSDLGELTSRPFLPRIHASLARWLPALFFVQLLNKAARVDFPCNVVCNEVFQIGVFRRRGRPGNLREYGSDSLWGRNRQGPVLVPVVVVAVFENLAIVGSGIFLEHGERGLFVFLKVVYRFDIGEHELFGDRFIFLQKRPGRSNWSHWIVESQLRQIS